MLWFRPGKNTQVPARWSSGLDMNSHSGIPQYQCKQILAAYFNSYNTTFLDFNNRSWEINRIMINSIGGKKGILVCVNVWFWHILLLDIRDSPRRVLTNLISILLFAAKISYFCVNLVMRVPRYHPQIAFPTLVHECPYIERLLWLPNLKTAHASNRCTSITTADTPVSLVNFSI